jgi:hypothetical protein
MLDIFFFIIFIIGILEVYILSNIESYYTKLQNDVIKRIINSNNKDPKNFNIPKKEYTSIETIIQYFNLFTLFIILIGLITPFWYIFLSLFIIIIFSNYIHTIYEINGSTLKKGGVNNSLHKLKMITYISLVIKVIVFIGLGLSYFHGLLI